VNPQLLKTCLLGQAGVALLATSVCLAQESDIASPSPPDIDWHGFPGLSLPIACRLNLQVRATPHLTVAPVCDMNVSPTCEVITTPADSANYYNLMRGVLLGFPLANYPNLYPWITTGLAYHYRSWDNEGYFIDDSVPFIGTGVDFGVGDRWDVRIEMNRTDYNRADLYEPGRFMSSTKQWGASLSYSFR